MRLPRDASPLGLVLTAVALVALVSILIAAATTIAMRDYLTDQLDDKVQSPRHPRRPGRTRGPGPMPRRHGRTGVRQPGARHRRGADRRRVCGFVVADRRGDEEPLPDAVVDVLADLPSRRAGPRGRPSRATASYRVRGRRGSTARGHRAAHRGRRRGRRLAGPAGSSLLGALARAPRGRRRQRPRTPPAPAAARGRRHRPRRRRLPLADRRPSSSPSASPTTSPTSETEVGQVGAALNTLLAHVESSLDARHRSEQQVRQFVADASHELRTPLTTIVGYTELARDPPGPGGHGDRAGQGRGGGGADDRPGRGPAAARAARLRPPARPEPVDLTRLLLEAVADARVLAPDHHWRLELPDDAPPVEVTGDEPGCTRW